ncbi:pentapeptide repeat-containing protein [Mucilaginibacter sp. cycad4]|uniref:pentapeptide repeat-containing protein n=1 Tax=Mucilaginibacter sp. cycad4 TaxID=3342096 RepID=UPI002AAC292B|nr:pentapeptide repeat-containing protein [Mucilaginibacter gossypii]WPU98893.1 pentapeptide repeat-containing protein [Mucilaginibacter gossypii]
MNIKEIKDRWTTIEGEKKLKTIIRCLQKHTSFDECAEKIDGRWDLRGIKLSEPQIKQYSILNYSIKENENILEFKDVKLKNIDFSFSDLSYTTWIRCEFENIKMLNTKANYLKFWACSMKLSDIEKTDFQNSLLGGRLEVNSGSFEDVKFKESKFNKTYYSFPLFKDCVFKNCNLTEVNFDGSRFEDCAFTGKLCSTIFRGITSHFEKQTFFEKKINPNDFPNLMKNVDFTRAELNGVSFINGVDLSTCKLPALGDYLLVSNLAELFAEVKATITSEWGGEHMRIGLQVIDLIYYTNHHTNQKLEIVDKTFLIEQFGSDFAEKFYGLVKRINSKNELNK